jgi:hypothetical protein
VGGIGHDLHRGGTPVAQPRGVPVHDARRRSWPAPDCAGHRRPAR